MVEKFLDQYYSYMSSTVCPKSLDPFYIVTYYVKGVMTSWPLSIQGSHKEKFFLVARPLRGGGGGEGPGHEEKTTFLKL